MHEQVGRLSLDITEVLEIDRFLIYFEGVQ